LNLLIPDSPIPVVLSKMTDLVALMTIIVWPVIPLFWIPVHGLPKIFKKIGLLTYVMPLVTWLPIAFLLFLNREFLLRFRTDFPLYVNIGGSVILFLGALLQIWTGKLLSLRGIMGMPEISSTVKSRLVIKGAFAYVRHPTYLSHTLILAGVFLMTGVTVAGIVALLDYIIINTVVIPLEDRELIERFGDEYRDYMKKVPKYFPGFK
jgi:protein-S-isoprenylcysteine O-methyltransferase Ste14